MICFILLFKSSCIAHCSFSHMIIDILFFHCSFVDMLNIISTCRDILCVDINVDKRCVDHSTTHYIWSTFITEKQTNKCSLTLVLVSLHKFSCFRTLHLICGFDMTKFAPCQSETCFRNPHFSEWHTMPLWNRMAHVSERHATHVQWEGGER